MGDPQNRKLFYWLRPSEDDRYSTRGILERSVYFRFLTLHVAEKTNESAGHFDYERGLACVTELRRLAAETSRQLAAWDFVALFPSDEVIEGRSDRESAVASARSRDFWRAAFVESGAMAAIRRDDLPDGGIEYVCRRLAAAEGDLNYPHFEYPKSMPNDERRDRNQPFDEELLKPHGYFSNEEIRAIGSLEEFLTRWLDDLNKPPEERTEERT